MRKYILITIFGALTFTTSQASLWQYRRYNQCVKKWDRVHSQFKPDHLPQTYQLNQIPSLTDYEYRVIQVQGNLIPTKTFRVNRYKDGRPGYLLIGYMQQDNTQVIVNLGWVPEDFEKTLEENRNQEENGQIDLKNIISMRCMVKKAEIKDFLSQKKGDNLEHQTYINIEKLNREFGINAPTNLFLERVGQENEGGGLGNDLYPAPIFGSSIEKPYLTPDVHQGYFMFWGSCTALGLLTMAKLIR